MILSEVLINKKNQIIALSISIIVHVTILTNSQFNFNQTDFTKQAFQVSLVAQSSLKNQAKLSNYQSTVIAKNQNSNSNLSSKKLAVGKISDNSQLTNSLDSEVIYDAKQLNNQAPLYPELAREKGIEGEVILKAKIDQNGKAISVELIKSSGSQMLDQSALKTVSNWNFIPAKINNNPVIASVVIPIIFKII